MRLSAKPFCIGFCLLFLVFLAVLHTYFIPSLCFLNVCEVLCIVVIIYQNILEITVKSLTLLPHILSDPYNTNCNIRSEILSHLKINFVLMCHNL